MTWRKSNHFNPLNIYVVVLRKITKISAKTDNLAAEIRDLLGPVSTVAGPLGLLVETATDFSSTEV
jgi:hypothetical protein